MAGVPAVMMGEVVLTGVTHMSDVERINRVTVHLAGEVVEMRPHDNCSLHPSPTCWCSLPSSCSIKNEDSALLTDSQQNVLVKFAHLIPPVRRDVLDNPVTVLTNP